MSPKPAIDNEFRYYHSKMSERRVTTLEKTECLCSSPARGDVRRQEQLNVVWFGFRRNIANKDQTLRLRPCLLLARPRVTLVQIINWFRDEGRAGLQEWMAGPKIFTARFGLKGALHWLCMAMHQG